MFLNTSGDLDLCRVFKIQFEAGRQAGRQAGMCAHARTHAHTRAHAHARAHTHMLFSNRKEGAWLGRCSRGKVLPVEDEKMRTSQHPHTKPVMEIRILGAHWSASVAELGCSVRDHLERQLK